MTGDVTVCLTNWMRPELFCETLESVRNQSVCPSVFVWNNGLPFDMGAIDWLVESSINKACWPRWFMALGASTEFVCIIDDDLVMNDSDVLRDAVEMLRNFPENSVLGIEGVILASGQSYRDSEHIKISQTWRTGIERCDIVKGKFMLMRSAALKQNVTLKEMGRTAEDDIAVSSLMAQGQGLRHICFTDLFERFTQHDAPHAIWRREGHFERRHAACLNYFRNRFSELQDLSTI